MYLWHFSLALQVFVPRVVASVLVFIALPVLIVILLSSRAMLRVSSGKWHQQVHGLVPSLRALHCGVNDTIVCANRLKSAIKFTTDSAEESSCLSFQPHRVSHVLATEGRKS